MESLDPGAHRDNGTTEFVPKDGGRGNHPRMAALAEDFQVRAARGGGSDLH
jgi:hypothetical protein